MTSHVFSKMPETVRRIRRIDFEVGKVEHKRQALI